MTNQVTVDKLIEMRLSAMSDAFLIQLNDSKMKDMPFTDRFGMLVDAEYTNRKNNSLKRLIKNASFDQPDAHISAMLASGENDHFGSGDFDQISVGRF